MYCFIDAENYNFLNFDYVKNETDRGKRSGKTIVAFLKFSHRWPNLLDLDKE